MKSIHLNRQSMQMAVFASRSMLGRLPYILLIQRFIIVRLVLLVVLGLAALYVVVTLLYIRAVPDTNEVLERSIILQTDSIDALEVWVEERQSERERSIIPGQRTYFQS